MRGDARLLRFPSATAGRVTNNTTPHPSNQKAPGVSYAIWGEFVSAFSPSDVVVLGLCKWPKCLTIQSEMNPIAHASLPILLYPHLHLAPPKMQPTLNREKGKEETTAAAGRGGHAQRDHGVVDEDGGGLGRQASSESGGHQHPNQQQHFGGQAGPGVQRDGGGAQEPGGGAHAVGGAWFTRLQG